MSISLAPLTHRALLTRVPCPVCLRDTLHAHQLCIHCGHSTVFTPEKKPAFGARLVLTPDWVKSKKNGKLTPGRRPGTRPG